MKLDILLFTENCGSSWLCDLMGRSDNVAYVDFEPLTKIIMAEDKVENGAYLYVDAILQNLNIREFIDLRKILNMDDYLHEQIIKINNSSIFLIKARANELEEIKEIDLAKSDVRLIFLKRKKELQHAISIYKRRYTSFNHFNNFSITDAINIEREGFISVLKKLIEDKNKATLYYNSWSGMKMTIEYEDFLINKDKSLNEIAVTLGYKNIAFDGYFKKITSENLSEAVINHEEVLSWFQDFKNLS